jgi:hypothetical protein
MPDRPAAIALLPSIPDILWLLSILVLPPAFFAGLFAMILLPLGHPAIVWAPVSSAVAAGILLWFRRPLAQLLRVRKDAVASIREGRS